MIPMTEASPGPDRPPAAETLDEQLARRRAACWALTGVTTAIAAGFFALFAAFDRPDLGVALAAMLWLPIVVFAWRDHARVVRTVQAHRDAAAARGSYRAP